MDKLTEIWNEAVDFGAEGEVPLGTPEGVAKLASALRVYNSIMGGGVGFALEVNEPFRVAGAIDGLRYFGLTEVAGLLAEISDGYGLPGYDAARVSAKVQRVGEYFDIEDPLEDAFRAIAAERPDDFGLER